MLCPGARQCNGPQWQPKAANRPQVGNAQRVVGLCQQFGGAGLQFTCQRRPQRRKAAAPGGVPALQFGVKRGVLQQGGKRCQLGKVRFFCPKANAVTAKGCQQPHPALGKPVGPRRGPGHRQLGHKVGPAGKGGARPGEF